VERVAMEVTATKAVSVLVRGVISVWHDVEGVRFCFDGLLTTAGEGLELVISAAGV
jgi:hypothetical protein